MREDKRIRISNSTGILIFQFNSLENSLAVILIFFVPILESMEFPMLLLTRKGSKPWRRTKEVNKFADKKLLII